MNTHILVSETHQGLVSFHLKAAVNLFSKQGAMQGNIKRTRRLQGRSLRR